MVDAVEFVEAADDPVVDSVLDKLAVEALVG